MNRQEIAARVQTLLDEIESNPLLSRDDHIAAYLLRQAIVLLSSAKTTEVPFYFDVSEPHVLKQIQIPGFHKGSIELPDASLHEMDGDIVINPEGSGLPAEDE